MNMTINNTLLSSMMTNTGENINNLSQDQPLLLVFLRHFGCVFCKEALSDLQEQREVFKSKGVGLVFIHMAEYEVAEEYFQKFNFDNVLHVSDIECEYYAAFGLTKGKFSQLYGLQTWIRGYALNKEGHKLEMAKSLGDSTQMPGIFLVSNGSIKEKYIHKEASSQPDYNKLICCSL